MDHNFGSLQSRCLFLTKAQRYTDRDRPLKTKEKPSISPLKSPLTLCLFQRQRWRHNISSGYNIIIWTPMQNRVEISRMFSRESLPGISLVFK